MKKLLITYHMTDDAETAETCITLPMMDVVADDILKKGADSAELNPVIVGEVYRVLYSLSLLQGYEYDCFICAEEV